jgi:GTPase SAR1 family protein
VGVAAASAVGAAVAWSQKSSFKTELKGKVVTVLGPRGVGKTTLVTFLSRGELPVEYIATVAPKKFSGRTIELNELKLVLQTMIDLPGDKHSYGDWEHQYKKADVVCYILDASKIHSGDTKYTKLVTREMRNIGEWLDDRAAQPPHFFLVATHCDLIAEYAELSVGRKNVFLDAFWNMEVMQQLVWSGRGLKHVRHIAGSLANKADAEHLVGELLHKVAK